MRLITIIFLLFPLAACLAIEGKNTTPKSIVDIQDNNISFTCTKEITKEQKFGSSIPLKFASGYIGSVCSDLRSFSQDFEIIERQDGTQWITLKAEAQCVIMSNSKPHAKNLCSVFLLHW